MDMAELEKIGWIGCGKVGRTLARALKEVGFQIGTIRCRNADGAKKAATFIGAGHPTTEPLSTLPDTVYFITTNDDAIRDVVKQIDEKGPSDLKGKYFFHTSGSVSSTILEPLRAKGAEIGSIHPLQVFADAEKALETLPGIYYSIEGTERAMTLAIHMVDRLKGKLLLIPTGRKILYHVAGVFAANYLVVLVKLVLEIMEDLGETPEDAYQAFLPLMVGALQNIEEFGVGEALTGPIARGDRDTIVRQIEALRELRPEILRAYKILGQEAVEIAARSGKLSADQARKILELFAQNE
jgi:predicted short-subunit dehydrogenase-like oxidoreductase (DUF2520 family)